MRGGAERAILVVLDGVGVGAAPDAPAFNDPHLPHTLQNVWDHAGPIKAPTLARCGLFASGGVVAPTLPEPGAFEGGLAGLGAKFGRLKPRSKGGKDSVTGHWEMMGLVLDEPFPTYPNGFPIPLIGEFEKAIGTRTLGNRPASGTAIIAELGQEHVETGFPIVYTSADSVFQIAAHEEIVPIENLYRWCETARELCRAPNNVQRVIARPFEGRPGAFRRTERRRDYPLTPETNLLDAIAERFGPTFGIGVVPELFGGRGFRPVRRTQSNPEHAAMLAEALRSDASFIFANFEDFDMLYGHRSDPDGFARCLEQFDAMLAEILGALGPGDLLILTSDHGNDPTDDSTDHTREYAPICVVAHGLKTEPVGDLDGFACVGATAAKWLGLAWSVGRPVDVSRG
ncbi:MAG: phosphopentomutase [Fimbriimonadaceae bacterium]